MIGYIAGPVSGMPNYNRPAFMDADALLVRHGFRSCNPALIGDEVFRRFGGMGRDPSWYDFMRACIPRLAVCDFVFLLPGWRCSRGARIERWIAIRAFGIPVFESIDDVIEWASKGEKIAV